jgi:hypothetical protein
MPRSSRKKRLPRGPKGSSLKIDDHILDVLCGIRVPKEVMRTHPKVLVYAACLPARPMLHPDILERFMKELTSIWEEVRFELTEDFARRHPGQRPIAFYKFECPGEQREVVEGAAVRYDPDPNLAAWPENFLERDSDTLMLQSSAAFLEERDLLYPWEKKVLTAEDFKPRKWKVAAAWNADDLNCYQNFRRYPGDYDPRKVELANPRKRAAPVMWTDVSR